MKTIAIQIPDDADENAAILAAERAVSPDWIASWWHIDDVKCLVDDENEPSNDTCREVLHLAIENHDANQGINWDTLRYFLDHVTEVAA